MIQKSRMLVLTLALCCYPTLAHGQDQKLTEAEKARIKQQVESLKQSKIKEAESANKAVKEQALRDGAVVDQKADQYNKQVDKAVENFSPRFGTGYTVGAGDAKKEEIKEKAKAEKDRIAKEARKKGAAQMDAAKKATSAIDEEVEGLKSQVSKSDKFGLKPKGSGIYVRNYGGK